MVETRDDYLERLSRSRKGGAVLFCGSGFSADCLNFQPDLELGTGGQLLELINEKLADVCDSAPPVYKNLQNAAEALEEKIGENGMMEMLIRKFRVAETKDEHHDIVKYPWSAIYTTNYDNALETSLTRAKIDFEPLNNTDDPNTPVSSVPVVHLHGFVNSWNILNFKESCVLTSDSYLRLTHVDKWFERLRNDIRIADLVVFVGFSASDFHISQAIYDRSGLKSKTFFINMPAAEIDPDVAADQSRLGRSLYLGKEGFARDIVQTLQKEQPAEPMLSAFRRFGVVTPAEGVPTIPNIENLLMFGTSVPDQQVRDVTNSLSDFHLLRETFKAAQNLVENGNKNIILITGYVCDGKTMLVTDLAHYFSRSKPVFWLKGSYASLLDDASKICDHYPEAVLVIENCFDLRPERLRTISKMVQDTSHVLLMTSRGIAADAEEEPSAQLRSLDGFIHLPIPKLSEEEAEKLVSLVDQFGGWTHLGMPTTSRRKNFIMKSCNASLPSFLVQYLNSDYVKGRYKEELNRISMNKDEKAVVIGTFYLAHLGHAAPIHFLSDALKLDAAALVARMNGRGNSGTFRLIRQRGEEFETLPSIGATSLLDHFFEEEEVVDTVVSLLTYLVKKWRDDYEGHLMREMLRYSHLSKVIKNKKDVDRFFDHVSREPEFRSMPLFWMHRHMAMADHNDFENATRYLDNGFTQAHRINAAGGWDFTQLNDRKSKFLMKKLQLATQSNSDEALRDFWEAIKLTTQIINGNDPQHYPFETLLEIHNAFKAQAHHLTEEHLTTVRGAVLNLIARANKRIGLVEEGYQSDRAGRALRTMERETKSYPYASQ